MKVGNLAGSKTARGYVNIKVLGKSYPAHRLAWLYMYGEWPENLVDHINRVPWDNCIGNLREATSTQNNINHSVRKDSKHGVTGVSWISREQKWRVRLHKNNKNFYLGEYKSFEDAVFVKEFFSEKLYGSFLPR